MITARLLVISLISLLSLSDMWGAQPGAQRGTKRKAPEPIGEEIFQYPSGQLLRVFEGIIKQAKTIKQLKQDVTSFAVAHPSFNEVANTPEWQKLISDQILEIVGRLQDPVNHFFNRIRSFKEGRYKIPDLKKTGLDVPVGPFDDPLITFILRVTLPGNNNLEEGFRLIQLLVANDVSLTKVNKMGNTPLHMAILNDNMAAAYYLILHGADVNQPDKNGKTPLMYAASSGRKDICVMLLNNGADVFAKTKSNPPITALGFAHSRLFALRELPSYTPDLDMVKNIESIIEILDAKMNKGGAKIGTLQKAIYDFFIKISSFNRTPSVIPDVRVFGVNSSFGLNNDSILNLVIDATSEVNKNIEEGFRLIELLINSGALVNQANAVGETPLARAVSKNNISVAYYLIMHGADVNQATNIDTTPLMVAVQLGYVDMVKMLLSSGADVSKVRYLGSKQETALTIAHASLVSAQQRGAKGSYYTDAVTIYNLIKDRAEGK